MNELPLTETLRHNRISREQAAALLAASFSLIAVLLSGCEKASSLPEQGTYAQQLYVQRCGVCHRPYSPASMTAAMWQWQVEAMDVKIAQAGQLPLSSQQQLAILAYLKRNAGSQ